MFTVLVFITAMALSPVVFMVFGALQKICVSLTTWKLAQAVPPIVTPVTAALPVPVKPVPTTVNAGPDSVPATVLAVLGDTKVTVAGVI